MRSEGLREGTTSAQNRALSAVSNWKMLSLQTARPAREERTRGYNVSEREKFQNFGITMPNCD